MTNNAKNNDLLAKIRREAQKGQEIYKERPYCEENRPLKNVAVLVYYTCSFFSWITQLYGLWYLSFLWLSSFLYTQVALWLAVALALIAATVVEVVKNIIVHRFFKSYFNSEKDVSIPLGFGMVGMFAISLGLSFYASLYIPNVITEAPTLTDVSKIEKEFDAHLEDLKNERNTFRENRLYLGKLASKDASVVHDYNKKIKVEKEAKQKALEAAQEKNNVLVSDWATANNSAGLKIGWFMVLLECLLIPAVAYYYYFYWLAYYENPPSGPVPSGHKKRTQHINLDDDDEDAGHIADNHDSGQTRDSTGLDLDSSTSSTGITDVEYVEVMDNDKVDLVKRVKDAISKNYQRSFTSSTPEARKANSEKLKERAEYLKKEFGIKCHFDDTNKKVLFSNTKTA